MTSFFIVVLIKTSTRDRENSENEGRGVVAALFFRRSRNLISNAKPYFSPSVTRIKLKMTRRIKLNLYHKYNLYKADMIPT
jgi:hypothetical protein